MNGSKISKNVAYVLAPIFALLLILSTLGTKIIDEEINVIQNSNYIWQMAGGLANVTKGVTPLLIPISVMILIILAVVVIDGIGKNKNEDTIKLNWFDEWKLEVVLALSFILFIAGVYILSIGWNSFENSISIMLSSCGIGIIYVNSIVLLETIVKRIKARMLWKTTLIYAIYKAIKKMIDNRKIMTKLFIYYWGFCIIGFFITLAIPNSTSNKNLFQVVMLAALGITTFYVLCKKVEELNKIQMALKSIYDGDTNIELNPNELKGVLKQMAVYIDDIAGGLSNAIEQSLKSERLKTELITNVSHDIKTPLTSIINYVALLKKEKMPNEKATEYLMILDNKSQRLKKLTEDLVEASKASSGNIKLNKEKLNVKELVQQVSGEFEDRFKERNLEEITTFPEQDVYIKADGRYMCRILENVYSNVAKYAMENTRVYLDVVKNQHTVVIQMKNISKQELNISADELMQRFVRGETSRNTEGSGLGLSIASSLTELQGGKFHIYLDGDLFKVTIGFEMLVN